MKTVIVSSIETPFLARISSELQIPIVSKLPPPGIYLHWCDQRLTLHCSTAGQLSLDFEEYWRQFHRQISVKKRGPLARAIAIKGDMHPLVWDISCGTAKDSFLLLSFGVSLVAFERSNIIAALLYDALRRCALCEKLPFNFCFGDPYDFTHRERPEVIYFDPMYFDVKKRRAIARKEMRIFAEVVGQDLDAAEYLKWAQTFATKKVVVKRSRLAPPLLPGVVAQFIGKSTRYDMYLVG